VTLALCLAAATGCGGRVGDHSDRASGGASAGTGGIDGGCTEAGASGRSLSELAADLSAEIDGLNWCDVVEDCQRVEMPWCHDSRYINSEADRALLDELLDEYRAVSCDDDQGCTLICLCATLTCTEGQCLLSDGNCDEPPDGGISTCR
jgi:hypothetical protein